MTSSALTGKDAADDEDARVGTEAARFNAFFDAGDAEPVDAPARTAAGAQSSSE